PPQRRRSPGSRSQGREKMSRLPVIGFPDGVGVTRVQAGKRAIITASEGRRLRRTGESSAMREARSMKPREGGSGAAEGGNSGWTGSGLPWIIRRPDHGAEKGIRPGPHRCNPSIIKETAVVRPSPDDYFADWKARETLTQEMIPMIGKLARDKGVEIFLY